MKKAGLFLVILSVSIMAVAGIALFAGVPKTVSLTVFPKSHNMISLYDTNDLISFEIYTSEKQSYLTDAANITGSYLCDREKEEQLKLEITEIENIEGKALMQGKSFYGSVFRFLISFEVKSFFQIDFPDAVLVISYRQGETAELSIGSFTYTKVPQFGSKELALTHLKGSVGTIDGIQTLTGIQMTLKNYSDEPVILKNIRPAAGNIDVSYDNCVLNVRDFSNDESISSIIGKDFDPKKPETKGTLEFAIPSGESAAYFFPLFYHQVNPVNRTGLIIEYETKSAEKAFYYDDFTFFTASMHSEAETGNLIFYTYANH